MEKTEMIKWANQANRTRNIIIAVAIYYLLYIIVPYQKQVALFYDVTTPLRNVLVNLQHQSYFLVWIFVPIMFGLEMLENNSRVVKAWNTLAKMVIPVGYPLLVVLFILGIAKVPAPWWSWPSLGAMLSLSMLTITLLKDRIGEGKALVLSAGFICFAIAFWEVPYAWLIFHYHYSSGIFFSAKTFLVSETAVGVPNILGGLFIAWFYEWRYKLLRFNPLTLILVIIFIGAWIVWCLLGFWCVALWNGAKDVLIPPTPTSWIQSWMVSTSKVSLDLLMISLVWRQKANES